MNHEQPIIIVKKKAKGHAHHGGSWKVAYADFVTAMMAFFLVMWILGLNQDTRKSIAAYFNDPTGMMKSRAGGASVISVNPDGSVKRRAIASGKDALLKFKKDQEALKGAKEEIEKRVADSARFRALKDKIVVSLTRDGLRIELLEDRQALFFESGSSKLRPYTVELLRLIGPVLSTLPNNIVLEGHTDARPYSGGIAGYSNWDLSTDRANAARKALAPTLSEGQLAEVRGYAATRLRSPADPLHYSNRRISILVQALDYREGVPTHEADEQGLIEDLSIAPNLKAEFQAGLRAAGGGAEKAGH